MSAPLLPPLPEVLEGSPRLREEERSYEERPASGLEEVDFTKVELSLEKEVEQALRELEAADAAMAFLRQQLENATDDMESSHAELSQLKRVAESWEKAAEEGRRELQDRRDRIEELTAVLPPDLHGTAAVWQDVVETQRQDLAAERLRVLEHQTSHLEEQVAAAQEIVRARIEERRALEKQCETLTLERDGQRAAQRDARSSLKAVEARLKAKEEAAAAEVKRREALERQLVRVRGESHGLRARLASATAAKAAAEAAAVETAAEVPIERRRQTRALSLRLQKEVLQLWEALKRSDEEVQALGGSPQPPWTK